MTTALEELVPGRVVSGLVQGEAVIVVAAEWHGDTVVTLTYRRPSGEVASELVYRGDEARFDVQRDDAKWAFDADGRLFRLAAEARRIRLAHLFGGASRRRPRLSASNGGSWSSGRWTPWSRRRKPSATG